MHSAFQRFLDHLRRAEVPFDVAADFRELEDVRLRAHAPGDDRITRAYLGAGFLVEDRNLAAGLHADHATDDVARILGADARILAEKGARALDVGCGSGMLAIQAARLGAQTFATDVCPDSLDLARANAAENGVSLELREGHLCEPVRAEAPFDLIVANLPHKPGVASEGLPLGQAGGPEGDQLWEEAHADLLRLCRPQGRFHFFLHSLPHPRLLCRVAEGFDLELRSLKRRRLGADEYGPELRERFRRRAEEGRSFLAEDAEGEFLVAAAWTGTRR